MAYRSMPASCWNLKEKKRVGGWGVGSEEWS